MGGSVAKLVINVTIAHSFIGIVHHPGGPPLGVSSDIVTNNTVTWFGEQHDALNTVLTMPNIVSPQPIHEMLFYARGSYASLYFTDINGDRAEIQWPNTDDQQYIFFGCPENAYINSVSFVRQGDAFSNFTHRCRHPAGLRIRFTLVEEIFITVTLFLIAIFVMCLEYGSKITDLIRSRRNHLNLAMGATPEEQTPSSD